MVEGPAAHGMTGLVNLFGIESPGLTSSLPLADDVIVNDEALAALELAVGRLHGRYLGLVAGRA